jgi:hypothetical protein
MDASGACGRKSIGDYSYHVCAACAASAAALRGVTAAPTQSPSAKLLQLRITASSAPVQLGQYAFFGPQRWRGSSSTRTLVRSVVRAKSAPHVTNNRKGLRHTCDKYGQQKGCRQTAGAESQANGRLTGCVLLPNDYLILPVILISQNAERMRPQRRGWMTYEA